jgi:4-diphosphocytidyl-2-C-methyl-D-erythritol kinase
VAAPVPLVENAPAKVNLTLRVLGRRSDGYHEIESLVAFAGCADVLSLMPGDALSLAVRGRSATQAGEGADNLVLKAARALKAQIPNVALGAFDLEKNLPVSAGLGGGSADAAAALRLIARTNGFRLDDPRLFAAARATGADVPVCLDPRPRLMRGIGEKLSPPVALPPLPAVLINPAVALATKDVFAGWSVASEPAVPFDMDALAKARGYAQLLLLLLAQPNDLEGAAIALVPIIAEVLAVVRTLPGCGLARMSGSGATCFGLFASAAEATAAAKILSGKRPHWWVRASELR